MGGEYALREPPRAGVEFEHVRVVEKVRSGRWKVEWIDPNPGLVDFVKSANLIVPWKQRKALVRDEQHHETLARYSQRQWDGRDGPVSEAVNEVLEAIGEDLGVWDHGIISYRPEVFERVAARAGIEAPAHVYGYKDRQGTHHLPFECALTLARALAMHEPKTVLTHIEVKERQYETELGEPGRAYLLDLVNRWRASWALVRQWAGLDAAIAARDAEIKDLRDLMNRTVWEFRRDDVDPQRVAARLDRALHGR